MFQLTMEEAKMWWTEIRGGAVRSHIVTFYIDWPLATLCLPAEASAQEGALRFGLTNL
jgi:hypothetical protein